MGNLNFADAILLLEGVTAAVSVIIVLTFLHFYFILNPKQVFRLFLAILYLGLAFFLILVRNSFITKEISDFSACFTGGLGHNK